MTRKNSDQDKNKENQETLAQENASLKKRCQELHKTLKEQQEFGLRLFSSNESVKLLLDPASGAVIDSNAEARHFYGSPAQTLVRTKLWDLSLLTEAQLRRDMLWAKKGWRRHFEDKHRLPSGEIRDVIWSAAPVKYKGKLVLFVIVQDISAWKRSEALLASTIEEQGLLPDYARSELVSRSRSEELSLLLNATQTQIWYLQDIETYGRVNKAHAAFFGKSPRSMEYRKLSDLFEPESYEACLKRNRQVFAEARTLEYKAWFANALGEQCFLQISKTPSLNREGQVEYLVGSAVDITERKKAEKAMEKANRLLKSQANLDALTGLNNRRTFDAVLHREWQRAGRSPQYLSLLMFDIDAFKSFNDTYGHKAGDDCLKQVAKALKDAIHRPSDVITRYGGEEFSMILPDTDLEGALTVAETARSNVASLKIPHPGCNHSDILTISCGVASILHFQSPNNLSEEALLLAADKALYQAKEQGRNRVVCLELNSDGRISPQNTDPDQETMEEDQSLTFNNFNWE